MTPAPFDPVEALLVLTRHGVRFVLIGGIAGRVWGSPTVTSDLDACYDRRPENLEALAAALGELHAHLRVGGGEDGSGLPFVPDAATLARGLNFTFTTVAGDLDLLGLPAGTSGYDELVLTAEQVDLGGVAVLVADIEALIAMKLAAGRAKDRIEVEILGAVREERSRRP